MYTEFTIKKVFGQLTLAGFDSYSVSLFARVSLELFPNIWKGCFWITSVQGSCLLDNYYKERDLSRHLCWPKPTISWVTSQQTNSVKMLMFIKPFTRPNGSCLRPFRTCRLNRLILHFIMCNLVPCGFYFQDVFVNSTEIIFSSEVWLSFVNGKHIKKSMHVIKHF